MSNTEQIVRQIIDILSDGVSELVLLVVVLREQNATMPPTLPTSTNAVNETAKKLGLIARKLASTDYKDFAEISQEINVAADALDQATAVLAKAVTVLSGGGERKKGWDNLVDSCRVMSGKTIRLLQIVYGAPMKRLKINADRLIDDINNFAPNPKTLADPKSQQKVLDDLKPITEKALRMERHLGDRAKLAESPQARQQLQDAAADVRKKAQDLVDAVNKSFNDPSSTNLQKPLDALRDAVEKGRDLSEKTAPPAPKGLPDSLPKGQQHSSGPKTLHDQVQQAKEMARAIPNIAAKEPINLPDAQDRLRDEVDQIRKKAHTDPEQWNNDVEEPLNNQIKAARDLAKSPKNPAAKKDLDDATDKLVRALDDVDHKRPGANPPGPYGPSSSRPPANNKGREAQDADYPPSKRPPTIDPQTKKKMIDQIKDIGPDLEKAINNPELKPELDQAKLKDNLQNLRNDIKQQKPKQANQHAKQAALAAKDLADDLRENAKNPNLPPNVRKAREDAAQELEKAIPEFVAAAREANKDLKADAPVRELQDKIKKLERAAQRAVPKPAPHGKVGRDDWKDAKDDMQKALDAIKKGDKAAAQAALDRAGKPFEHINAIPGRGIADRDPAAEPADEIDRLADQFREAAERGDPDVMDRIIPEIENQYKKYSAVPKKAADRFQDAVDEVADAIKAGRPRPPIKNLQDAYDQFVNDTDKDPSPEVREAGQRAADEIRPRLDDFIRKAEDAARNPNDKRKAQAVNDAAPLVKKPAEDFKNNIRPLDDGFQKAKDDMKKAADLVRKGGYTPEAKKVIDKLADRPIGRNFKIDKTGRALPPLPEPDGPSDELKKLWDKFKNAGKRGDNKAMDRIIPEIEREYKKLAEKPKEDADNLKDAVDDVVDAIRRGDTDPPIDDLRDAFDKFVRDTQKNPSPEVREAGKRAAAELKPKIDDLIRKADDAARHPNDKRKIADVENAAQQAKRPADDFKNRIKPLDDAFDRTKNEMKKAADAAKKGDLPAAQRVIDNVDDRPFGRNLEPKHKGPGARPPYSEADKAADDLDKLWDKFQDAVAKGNPKAIDKIIPKMEREQKKISAKPRDDADRFKDAVDDVVEAIRVGDPEPPLEDLKDAYDRFVDDTQNDPSPEVREAAARTAADIKPKLDDLIRKAADAAKFPADKKKIQEVEAAGQQVKRPADDFKERLKPLDDAFDKNKNEMKKAADAVRKGDIPAAKRIVEPVIEKPFGRKIEPTGRAEQQSPVDDLEKLWDKFQDAAAKGDPKAMDRLIPKIEKQHQKVSDRPKQAADRLKDAIDDVADAVKYGNPEPAIQDLRDAYDDFLNDTENDRSPEVREASERAAAEIKPRLDDLIRKAQDAGRNPQKAKDVAAAAAQAKKPVDDFKERIRPLDDAFQKNKEEMKKAAEAARKGDRPAAKRAIENIKEKPFGRNFTPGKGSGFPPPGPSDGPSEELKKLWDKFKNAGKRGDPQAMDKLLPQMEREYKKLAERPKDAADRVKDAVDDVVEAIKSGNPDPPVDALRDAYDRFVDDTENDPSPEVREAARQAAQELKPKVDDLIRKAKEAARNPGDKKKVQEVEAAGVQAKKPADAFKDKIKPLDDAFIKNQNEMKKAIDAARQGDKPATKRAIDNIDQKPFGRELPPSANKIHDQPEDDLEKLWDQFEDAAERGDAPAMDRILPRIEKQHQKVSDRPKQAADRLKDAVDDVVDAVKSGYPEPAIQDLKDAYDRFVNDTHNDPSPEVREAAAQAAQEMKPKLDDLIKKAEEAAKAPNNPQKIKDVEAAAVQAKKPVDAFKDRIRPLDDAFNKNKEEMKKAAEAARRGDKPAAKKAVENIKEKPFGRNFTPGKGSGMPPPGPSDGPSEELQKLWDKFRNAGNRGDPKAMDKIIPQMEREYKKMADKPKEAAARVQDAIDDVVEAIKNGNPDPPVNALKDAYDRFVNDTKNDPSPEVRKAAARAAQELKPKVDDLIKKAQEAARSPGDKKKVQEVETAGAQAKKPVDAFKDKLKDLDDAFDKNIKEMKKAADAARQGDKPATKQVLDNIAHKPFGRDIAPVPPPAPSYHQPHSSPVDDLDALWDKFVDAAEKGDPKVLDQLIPKIEKEYQKVSDKPKHAADKLQDAVDDVVEALKTGRPGPALADLQDTYDKFLDDALGDPSPEVREAAARAVEEIKPKLDDLVKKVEAAAKAPNDPQKAKDVAAAAAQVKKPVEDFKEKIRPLDDAFNRNKEEMKKAADAARKGDRPAAKQAVANISDKPFGRNFTPGKGKGPQPQETPADDLKKQWNKFKKAADKGDADGMNKLIPKMDRLHEKLSEKPKAAADKLNRAVEALVEAAQGGRPDNAIEDLREAFDKFVADTEDDPSPEVREAAADAAAQLKPRLDDLVKKALDAAKNPADKVKAQALAGAAAQAKKPTDAFKEKIKPLDHAWNRNKEEMKKAVDATRKGIKPSAKKIIDELDEKPFGRNFTAGKGRGLLPPDGSTGPSDELKDLWNKFKNAAKKGDAPAMAKTLPEFDKVYDTYNKAAVADPIAAADKLEKAIDDVMGAIDYGQPNLPLQELKDAYDNFQKEAQKPGNPVVAAAAQKAADDFKPQLVDFLNKAKDVVQNPGDKQKVRAVENAVPKMKKPLKNFKAEVDPSHANDVLVNDKYGADVKDALADLRDAVNARQPPVIQKAVDNVKDKLAAYNDKSHQLAKKLDDPGKAKYIDRKADDLDDLMQQLDEIKPQSDSPDSILRAVDDIPAFLDDILAHIGSDDCDAAVEAAARSTNLSAFLESVDEDDLDLGDLLGCASDLADLMRGMIGDTTSVAESFGTSGEHLTDAARSALELSNLLKELEGGDNQSVESAQILSEKVSALRSDQQSAGSPAISLADATTFEDITAAVAFNIKQQCEKEKLTVSKTGANVASELANLSQAARGGDRQKMLLSAKAASAHIAALSKEILALAQQIPGKNAQEKSIQNHLILCSQGLANYGTQLKILTSVKAASIEESKDTDESLSTLATDLGDLISQALTSMSITNSTILKSK